jgi:bifunctional oligoribonuclease and PAP phosphatase NrnA
MLDFNRLKNILLENNSFLITTHVNPDADAIGSEIALYNILRENGKQIRIVNHSMTPYNLVFLDKENVIEHFSEENHKSIFHEADVIVSVDFNRANRTVSMEKGLSDSNKIKVCIDHHQEPENIFDYTYVDTGYSATGQIIYDLIKQTNIVKLTYDIAEPIYAAIMTDTGSFRFERTTPGIHKVAAELLEAGVNPGKVYDQIYDQSKFSKIKLFGIAVNSMQLYGEDNEVSYMRLVRKDFENTKALESDTDGFVNISLSIENVKVGILFLELKEGFKVSFRSKGIIPVNKLAAEFGGGGHINAAGLRIRDGNIKEYFPQILNKAVEYVKQFG